MDKLDEVIVCGDRFVRKVTYPKPAFSILSIIGGGRNATVMMAWRCFAPPSVSLFRGLKPMVVVRQTPECIILIKMCGKAENERKVK